MPLFIGLMSGTSLDGIDAALVRCEDSLRPELLEAVGLPMPADLRQTLWTLCHADEIRFDTLAAAEHAFCRLQAEAVSALLSKTRLTADDIVAVGSHGQTIEHRPYAVPSYTYQLDNPNLLSELTGCTVVADFRRRDLAAGGQGAPLAPAFHAELFRDVNDWRVVLNLGGFANVTLLPPQGHDAPIIGFDTGPANALLDGWYARHHAGQHFDFDGRWAASGRVDDALLERMLAMPFFQLPPPKSTGREVFNLDWLRLQLQANDYAPVDVQATLAELTAVSVKHGISQALPQQVRLDTISVVPCGGGAHNADMLARLAHHLAPMQLASCQSFGWSSDWLEAGAFAWLAWRRINRLPGNLPTVTGARVQRVLGGVYAS